jgi:iron complex outermembrane receptor protein
MSRYRRLLTACLLSLCASTPWGRAAQQEAMTRELLLFIEVPTVVTATGRAQPLTQAPSAITVITAEEIRQSGATSIADLLRVVPGLDFFRISASNVSIAARGLNFQSQARMQVLVDGLSVYEDVLGLIYWHQIPIPLAEIDRIEVVRSPATALYGDKAFAGVVHIITKAPEALRGTHIAATGGEAGTGIVDLIHAGVKDRLSYKVSAGYDRTNQFPNPEVGRTSSELGRLDRRGHFQINYQQAATAKLSVAGGINVSDRREVLPAGFFQQVVSGTLGYLQTNYERDNLRLQLAYNHTDGDVRSESFFENTPATTDVFLAQLRHALALGRASVLSGGVSYRYATLDSPGIIGGRESQGVLSLFLQHEWKLRQELTATTGVGVDVHSEAGVRASPRTSLVYTPWPNHAFRASVAKSYRNPSLLENFEALTLRVDPPPPPGRSPSFTIFGNRNLKPEEMLSYELGYQTLMFERLRLRLDLFYNELDALIALAEPVFGRVSPLLPPVPIGTQYVNASDVNVWGGEIGIDVFVTSWLRGFVNYSYQKRKGPLALQDPTPQHKGNAGLTSTFSNGLSGTVLLHHAGDPEAPAVGVSPYTLVNLRLGYRFKLFDRDAELSVQAFNLFNDVHREFPRGDLIERRVSTSFHYRF